MVDASSVNAIFFDPSDAIREDPFVLPMVLGYLSMPDPTRWEVPTELNILLGITKAARVLGAEDMIEQLSRVLEIPTPQLRDLPSAALRKKLRNHLRYVCVHSSWCNG